MGGAAAIARHSQTCHFEFSVAVESEKKNIFATKRADNTVSHIYPNPFPACRPATRPPVRQRKGDSRRLSGKCKYKTKNEKLKAESRKQQQKIGN